VDSCVVENKDGQPEASHERLASRIREDLAEQRPDAHEPLPSYRSFSARYGVSLSTVQRAMGLLQEEGVLKRLERRGTFYQPPVQSARGGDTGAPRDGAGKLRCVNVVWGAPTGIRAYDASREAYLAGYTEALDQRHAAMRFVMPRRQVSAEHLLSPNIPRERQGCVFVYREFDLRLTEWLAQRGVPYVIQDSRPYFGPEVENHHRVCPNKPGGFAKVTQYLLSLGHARIGFVGRLTPEHGSSHAAFMSAMLQANLTPETRDMLDLATDIPDVARGPLRQYLRRSSLPTAVVAQTDAMALTLLEEASALGIRVPRDLSVTGFNGLSETETSDPPLTTVRLPYRALAVSAIELLTEVADGKRTTWQCRMLDCPMLVRQSAAPPGMAAGRLGKRTEAAR